MRIEKRSKSTPAVTEKGSDSESVLNEYNFLYTLAEEPNALS